MQFRPAPSDRSKIDAQSADVDDDSIEFAEFTNGSNSATTENESTQAHQTLAEPAETITRPAWLKAKPKHETEPKTSRPDEALESSSRARAAEMAGVKASLPRRERPTGRTAESGFDGVPKLDIDANDQPRIRIAGSLLLSEVVERAGKLVGLELQVGDEVGGRTVARETPLLALFKDYVLSEEARGYVASLTVHALILLALSLIISESFDENEAISTIITETESIDVNLTEIVALEMEAAGSEQTAAPQLQKLPLDNSQSFLSSDLATSIASVEGDGGGSGSDDGGGFSFKMPSGGKAVQKGSFTAWTVPADPEPREDYVIVIRIKLPKGTRTYRISDLSGKVIGTDTYEQEIPYDRKRPDAVMAEKRGRLSPVKLTDRLTVVDDHVQIMVKVQGAASLVEDTIVVRSKRLDEDQNIKIVF
jgi:hypothetical protein